MKLKNLLKTKKVIDRALRTKSALSIRLIFGLYYKLSTSPLVCYTAKLYCFLISGLNTYIFVYYVDSMFKNFAMGCFLLILFIETFLTQFVALCYEGDRLMEFYHKFKYFSQDHLQFSRATYIPHLVVLLMLIRNLFEYLHMSHFPSARVFFLHTSLYFMLATISSSYYTVLYITNTYRLSIRSVKMSLCNKLQNGNLSESDKFLCIRGNMNTYRSLTKIFISVNKLLRVKMIISLTCLFLRFILIVIFFITSSEIILTWTNELFFHTVIVYLPSIFMECVCKDLEVIKGILSKQLIVCKGEKNVCSSRYYTAWNGLLIDVNLALSFTNLCTTYAIAILQFTY
ncbi:hypothetical protein SFRURICE_014827 [Spodoptera frugiperda]|nr:hypothetical protein SFRURICE_014827 [Spodoptera frugiperda]